MSTNLIEIKQKILDFISARGPSLPVHLTKVTEMNLTFTSAILSELISDRRVKTSNLRVGSSALYFIPGQEEKLENFIENLKDPEKDAFKKLKENKILDDEKQDPVMRVALRAIRDFAIPLKNKDKLYWKYHLLSDKNATESLSDEPVAIGHERVIGQNIWEDIQKQSFSKEKVEEMVKKRVEEIAQKIQQEKEAKEVKKEEITPIEEPKSEKLVIPKKVKKTSKDNLFLEDVRELSKSKGIEILEILRSDKIKVIAKVRGESEFLAFFLKKKRFDETELLRDMKKYSGSFQKVEIFLKGEPSKKLTEKIEFYQKISKIQKIEEQ